MNNDSGGRLTSRKGGWIDIGDEGRVTQCIQRLADYEDIGTVEEFRQIKQALNAGRIHIAPCADGTPIHHADPTMADRIMRRIDADDNRSYRYGVTEAFYGELGIDWFIDEAAPEKEGQT